MTAVGEMLPGKDDFVDPTALKVYKAAQDLYEDLEGWLHDELEKDRAEIAEGEGFQSPNTREEVRQEPGQSPTSWKRPPVLPRETKDWPERWLGFYDRKVKELVSSDEEKGRGVQIRARRKAEEYMRGLYLNIVRNK